MAFSEEMGMREMRGETMNTRSILTNIYKVAKIVVQRTVGRAETDLYWWVKELLKELSQESERCR